MKFSLPADLTDPMVRDHDPIPHGDTLKIDVLSAEVERRRIAWLDAHPGWVYTGTDLARCADGSPSPAYDVNLGFKRPRTPAELEVQSREREAFSCRKEREFHDREESQRALLDEVLASLKRS